MLGLFSGLIHKIINPHWILRLIVYLKWKTMENTIENCYFKEQNDIIIINYYDTSLNKR